MEKLKKKISADFQELLRDQKGQLDLIGNILEIIKTQPWILPLLFLAFIYATTLSLNIMGVEFNLYQPLNDILGFIAGSFGFSFDWRLFVIICFFGIVTLFIFKYG